MKGWRTSENFYYPTAIENSITYKFNNINTTKYDICLELQYKSSQIVDLSLVYHFQNKENILFNASLKESETETLNFCLRYFRYDLSEEFSLSLQISGIEGNWNESVFSLISFKPNVRTIEKKSISLIYNWDLWEQTFDTNPASIQKWITIPNNLFTLSKVNKSPFDITFRGNNN